MKGLIYREFLLMRRQTAYSLFMFFCYSLICVLVMLSFKCGNLANLPPELIDKIEPVVLMMVKFVPACMFLSVFFAINNIIQKDEKVSWQRFCRCSPVSPWKFAAARTVTFAAATVIGLGLMAVYLAVIAAVTDTGVTVSDIAFSAVALIAFLILSVVIGLVTVFLHSMEKAIVAVFSLCMLIIFIFVFGSDNGANADTDNMTAIWNFCEGILPFTPLIFIGTAALNCVCTAQLLKRREK